MSFKVSTTGSKFMFLPVPHAAQTGQNQPCTVYIIIYIKMFCKRHTHGQIRGEAGFTEHFDQYYDGNCNTVFGKQSSLSYMFCQ